MKDFMKIFILLFMGSIIGLLCHECSPSRQGTEADTGTDASYYYIVSDKARGYIDGVETKTFEDYQEAVGTKPDGKAGINTCTATNFYNAQEGI
jgi:hypothetical protein